MSFNAALQAVESHLAANWTATPIAYENVDFTPPTGNWIKVMLITLSIGIECCPPIGVQS